MCSASDESATASTQPPTGVRPRAAKYSSSPRIQMHEPPETWVPRSDVNGEFTSPVPAMTRASWKAPTSAGIRTRMGRSDNRHLRVAAEDGIAPALECDAEGRACADRCPRRAVHVEEHRDLSRRRVLDVPDEVWAHGGPRRRRAADLVDQRPERADAPANRIDVRLSRTWAPRCRGLRPPRNAGGNAFKPVERSAQ